MSLTTIWKRRYKPQPVIADVETHWRITRYRVTTSTGATYVIDYTNDERHKPSNYSERACVILSRCYPESKVYVLSCLVPSRRPYTCRQCETLHVQHKWASFVEE